MKRFARKKKSKLNRVASHPSKQRRYRRAVGERGLAFESLESRAMLSLTVGWDPAHGALSVSGGNSDSILITDDTNVKVNGQDVGSGVLAADVQSMSLSGAASASVIWDRSASITASATIVNSFTFIPGATAINVTLDADSTSVNTLDFSAYSASQGVMIDLGITTAQSVCPGVLTLTLASGHAIDNVIGGAGNDLIFGNDRDNVLRGGSGNDYLDGRTGTNRLYGGSDINELHNGSGEWLVKFNGMTADTPGGQLAYVEGLLHDAGLEALGVEASAHSGVSDVVIVQADPALSFNDAHNQLSSLSGFDTMEAWNEDGEATRNILVQDSPIEDLGDGDAGDPTISDGTSLIDANIASSFGGMGHTNVTPPDSIGAAGPQSYIEGVNTSIAIYNKVGSVLAAPTTFANFFTSLGDIGNGFSDPVVVYNDITHQFGVGILDFHRNANNNITDSRFDFAISRTPNPTLAATDWIMNRYNTNDMVGGPLTLSDYPKIGFNADGFVVSFNMFVLTTIGTTQSSSFDHVSLLGIRNDGTSTGMRVVPGGINPITLAPASEHGAAPGAPMWFTYDGHGRGAGNDISLLRVDNPFATGAINSIRFVVSVNPYGATLAAGPRQPNGNLGFQTNLGTAFYFSALRTVAGVAHLVAAHDIGNGTGDSVRWYDFNITNSTASNGNLAPVVLQQGNVNPNVAEFDTYFPSVDIAPDGTIGMNYLRSGTGATDFMSMYVTGHVPTDAAGTMRTPILAQAGAANLNAGGRAGDYSFTCVDPVDGTFWGVNEYTVNIASNNWATWIQQFEFTPRVTDVILDDLAANGTRNWARAPYSYSALVPQGKQLAPIFTQGVNTIEIQFSVDVRHWNGTQLSQLDGTEFKLIGSGAKNGGATATINSTGFIYNSATRIAKLTYQTLPADRYRIEIDPTIVTDTSQNHLDGFWDNLQNLLVRDAPSTIYDWHDDPTGRPLVSGKGLGGSAFQFLFALMPGDYNQDSVVDSGDYVTYAASGSTVDGNGDGVHNSSDYDVWRSNYELFLWFQKFQGDYDKNGVVDSRDYSLWRMQFGTSGSNLSADGNGDGTVDSADYINWRSWDNSWGAWFIPPAGLVAAAAVADSPSAPRVANVTVSGSQSTHTPYSFATHVGSGDQLQTVPVGGADTISITFNEQVNVDASYLRVVGTWSAFVPTVVAFNYNPATFTATWQFANFSASDAYVLSLSDAVTNTQGYRLDGEWVNPWWTSTTNSLVSHFPSGNGHAGGNFNFVVSLFRGDVNLDGHVNFTDYQIFITYYGGTSGMLYTQGDFNGDGAVNFSDYSLFAGAYGTGVITYSSLGADLDGVNGVDNDDIGLIAGNLGMVGADYTDGDINGDGDVTAADLDIAFAQYGLRIDYVS